MASAAAELLVERQSEPLMNIQDVNRTFVGAEGLVRMALDHYTEILETVSDPRVNNWPLMDSPIPSALIVLLYLYSVTVLGPRLMANRKPFQLRNILVAYNAFQVIFSIGMMYEHLMSGWLLDYSYKCQPVDYSQNPTAMRMANLCWWYFISKFTEFADTIFFVLRKKDSQVTFLHLYHHSLTPLETWICVKFIAGGHGTLGNLINNAVHVVMYAYYMLSAMGPEYQNWFNIRDGSLRRIPSSPSVFTSDEYRAWMSRTPSTSALYEQIRATTTRPPRYTYSAENIHAAVNQADYGGYGSYRPLSSTLDRLSTRSASAQQVNLANLRASTAISSTSHRTGQRPASVASNARTVLGGQKPSLSAAASQRANSVRRIRNLLELEQTRNIPTPTPTRNQDQRLLDINPAEFLKYKIEKPPTVGTPSSTSSLLSSLGDNTGSDFSSGVSGLLLVHLLAGRGLRSTTSSSAATTPSTPSGQPSLGSCGLRDLYCVLECDRVHKARTVVRTGDLMFDWDETFELDLVGNRQLDLLVYSWDPQHRHKLCYKGSVHLATLLKESPIHQLALKVEPRGTIFLRLRYTDAHQTFKRRGLPVISLATRVAPLFGVDLDTVVSRECKTGGVPGGVSTALAMGGTTNIPIIVWRCVEEVERRGLDIIGLYRLCGSATKKRILREAFERNARSVDLSPDNVPDINVITGVLKDYLRELPEPLFTKCLYQMMVDALAVCLPDDPQGNAKLMFSILDCLPKTNRCTLIYLLDHLAMVVSQCNKMSPASLAVCFGPVLMLHAEDTGPNLDFHQPIAVLKYLLEIWPVKSVGSTLPRVTPTVGLTSSTSSSNIISNHHPLHHQLQQQQQHQQQQHQMSHQGTLTRTALPWQQPPSLHHPPLTSAPGAYVPSIRPPPPVKPRQIYIFLTMYYSYSIECDIQTLSEVTLNTIKRKCNNQQVIINK
ncbi:hypothetical protein PV327_004288 [Microctonus hyperodae]|uniref:Very-long-chain 3-oxoacyl-CoA synthase n=1 Tax=Microctonus hyperodae TaxID=165561 RepID=A0AA39FC59_MICHY|nr:hypothetical protein PV327_004288 [Microctonus hyperodae]